MLSLALPVLYTMLQIFTFLFIGFLLRRYGWFSQEFFTALGRFVVRIALPSFFFVRMSQADIAALQRSLRFPLLAIAVCAVGVLSGWIVFSIFRFPTQDRKAGIALSGFGNASYLPLSVIELMPLSLPLIAELFDTDLSLFYVGAFVFVFSPLLWSFGMVFISGGSGRDLLRGLISPPMIGIAAGLLAAVSGLGPILSTPGNPLAAVYPAFERIGAVTVPIILIVLGSMAGGLHLHRENIGVLLGLSTAVSLTRFVILPTLFLLLAPLFQAAAWSPTELWVVFLQFTTPPATNLSVMASHAGINQEHTAFTLLITYLIYLFVFPVYLMLFLQRLQLLPAAGL
ncbi:AEC family transporter [Spirochaeta africana]|nr:AEC family transporter [Spirochaeta africana]